MVSIDQDEGFMRQALGAAEEAYALGEVPVGALLVCESDIFSAYNLRERRHDPTAHAEILVLQKASKKLGRWRLGGTLYTTLEPCLMCAAALGQARIDRLVYGACDPKGGGCGSLFDLVREPRLNHQIEVSGGVLEDASSRLLRTFFKALRN
ncbi:MAG: tRNA adenosine(34) deaminase TadA [Nitrospiria bacterium]